MFIGRFGYFLNQIKLNKFYQFLVLSGRFVLPPSARQKKKKKVPKTTADIFPIKVSFKCITVKNFTFIKGSFLFHAMGIKQFAS